MNLRTRSESYNSIIRSYLAFRKKHKKLTGDWRINNIGCQLSANSTFLANHHLPKEHRHVNMDFNSIDMESECLRC
jgi:hypothetical protein